MLSLRRIDGLNPKDMEEYGERTIPYEELVELYQDGKISKLRFVLESHMGEDFLEWCESRDVDPSDVTAEFYEYLEEKMMMDNQMPDTTFTQEEWENFWANYGGGEAG